MGENAEIYERLGNIEQTCARKGDSACDIVISGGCREALPSANIRLPSVACLDGWRQGKLK